MKTISRIGTAEISSNNVDWHKVILSDENQFRFFKFLNQYIGGTTTSALLKSVIDSMVIPVDFFRQGITEKMLTLRADVLVNDSALYLFYLQMNFLIETTGTVSPSTIDDMMIVNTVQIKIPSYQKVIFKEISNEEEHKQCWGK